MLAHIEHGLQRVDGFFLFRLVSRLQFQSQRKRNSKCKTVLQFLLHAGCVQTNDAHRIIYGFIIVEFLSVGSLCTILRKRLFVQTPISKAHAIVRTNENSKHTHKNRTNDEKRNSSTISSRKKNGERADAFLRLKCMFSWNVCSLFRADRRTCIACIHNPHWFIIFYFNCCDFVNAQLHRLLFVQIFSLGSHRSTVRFVKLILTLCHSELNLITLFIFYQMDLLHSNYLLHSNS